MKTSVARQGLIGLLLILAAAGSAFGQEATITIFKPGVDAYSISGSAAEFYEDGSLRIGNNSPYTTTATYRFSIPRLGTLTDIKVVVYGEERNINPWAAGTEVQVRRSAENWITLGYFPPGTGPWDRSTSSPGDWLSGDIDAGVVDLLDIRFVNKGFDDMRLDSIELELIYEGVLPFHLETFQVLYSLYQDADDYWHNHGQHIKQSVYADQIVEGLLQETAVGALTAGASAMISAGGYDLLAATVPAHLAKAAALARFAHEQTDAMAGLLQFNLWFTEKLNLLYFPSGAIMGGTDAGETMNRISEYSSQSADALLELAQSWFDSCTDGSIDQSITAIQTEISTVRSKIRTLEINLDTYVDKVDGFNECKTMTVALSTKKYLLSLAASVTSAFFDDDRNLLHIDEHGEVQPGKGANWATLAIAYLDDLSERITPGPVMPGDANGDGRVDLDDFMILKQNFGRISGATWGTGDFNGDGRVDLDDFMILKRNFGAFQGDELTLDCGDGVTMRLVRIPAGTFMMGSPETEQDRWSNEGPMRQVTLTRDFYMGVYPVTQRQYLAVMGTNPSYFTSSGLDAPVERVSWHDAMAFCAALSQRTGRTVTLPTEAQWEYACRAGSTTRFYYGDDPTYALLGDYAWYSGNSDSRTHPVGQKAPNAWGLYDMHGHVWEWCRDWYASSYADADNVDPLGPATGSSRVLRGGSWTYFARVCRSAGRTWTTPVSGHLNLGFRVVVAPGGLD